MKKFTAILIGFGSLFTGVQAQAVLDTSILKNGNTWLYSRRNESRSAGQLTGPSYAGGLGFSGTVRFTIDSLMKVQDTLKFKVIRRDVGQYLEWAGGSNPNVDTIQTTRFTFRNGTYSPSTPFFVDEQSFSDTDIRKVFRGDTVRMKSRNASGCSGYNYVNIQKIGRITNSETSAGCGNTSGQNSYQLKEFNGWVYSSDSITPVGIRPFVKQLGSNKAQVPLLRKHQVLLEKQGRAFDLKGQTEKLKAR